MPNAIEITKDFPSSRERTVLLELLQVARVFKNAGIEAVICGGWVPFLKELSKRSATVHTMSLDIDLLLPASAHEPAYVDRVQKLLTESLAFTSSKEARFRYEKTVGGNVVQLDVLTDLQRTKEDESIVRLSGKESNFHVCLVEGAEHLSNRLETIKIFCKEGDNVDVFEIIVPDAVGFLILKTAVMKVREKPKDPYDIYHYCRYSEDPARIRDMLAASIDERAVVTTVMDLKRMFGHTDSKWVEMVLDHMGVTGEDRDLEAQFIIRSIAHVTSAQ